MAKIVGMSLDYLVKNIGSAAFLDVGKDTGQVAPAGNYAYKGDSYTKAEADNRHQPKGNYATVEDLKKKLTKNENGADIPDKPKFIENLGLGEAAKMPAAELVVNGNTLSAKIPVLAGSARVNLIIQASRISSSMTSGTIIFPSAFPNECVMILSHDFSTSAYDLSNVRFNIPGKSSVSWHGQHTNTGSAVAPAAWGWLAIGW